MCATSRITAPVRRNVHQVPQIRDAEVCCVAIMSWRAHIRPQRLLNVRLGLQTDERIELKRLGPWALDLNCRVIEHAVDGDAGLPDPHEN